MDRNGVGGGLGGSSLPIRPAPEPEREGVAWLRQFAEELDDAFGLTDAKLKPLFISPDYERLTGRSCRSLQEDPSQVLQAVHPDDRDRLQQGIVQVCERPFRGQFCFLRPDGSKRWAWMRASPLRDADGKIQCVVWLARDITRWKQMNEALRESQESYRILAEMTSDYGYCFRIGPNAKLEYEWTSDAFSRVTGFGVDEAIERGWMSIVHPEDVARVRESLTKLVETHATREDVFRVIAKNGETRWLRTLAKPVLDETNSVVRLLGAAQDITESKQAEERRQNYAQQLESDVDRRTQELQRANRELRELQGRLIEAERMGAAEQLAGSVAHSINNPLAALIGTIQMALEATPKPKADLKHMLKLARRIQDVVDRTLQLFRQGSLDLNAEDVGGVLAEVRDELMNRAAERDVGLELRIEAKLPRISSDRSMLRTALASITENALIASPSGGTLWLEALSMREANGVRFTIADEGPGIAAELREKIFEPFFSTKGSCAGLGLAIARGIIQGHHGTLRVDEREGGGAVFTVELPCKIPGASKA